MENERIEKREAMLCFEKYSCTIKIREVRYSI